MKQKTHVKPLVKWAGGKRQLLNEIRKYIPAKLNRYYEPFLGGGAVWFDLQPDTFVVNDLNADIMNVYQVVKTDVDALIAELKTHKNDAAHYDRIRRRDRNPAFNTSDPVQRAARLLYLNKTCFNGLFRVNRQGYFNVSFGNYKKPDILNEATLRAVSQYLNETEGTILTGDFAEAVRCASRESFVYFDPPYVPLDHKPSFTGYTATGFGPAEQHRLKAVCDDLTQRGCKFLLSNSSTEFIHDLYQKYRIVTVQAKRSINRVADQRGNVEEVLIRNYD